MEDYAQRHGESWVKFSRDKGFGDIRPVLVSGFDMTRDYAMLVYSDKSVSLDVGAQFTFLHAPAITVTCRQECSPHFRCGPGPWDLSPIRQVKDFSSSRSADPRTPNGFNQCVFIRYYTMRRRDWLFRMFWPVPRVEAGSHDPSPRGNRGDTFPDSTVHTVGEASTDHRYKILSCADFFFLDCGDLGAKTRQYWRC